MPLLQKVALACLKCRRLRVRFHMIGRLLSRATNQDARALSEGGGALSAKTFI